MKYLLTLISLFASISLYSQVSPLLSTTWDQGCYYNADCPSVSSGGACGKAWTGCNATAWAQIFKYYNFPDSTMGSNYCNAYFPSECVDFSNQGYNYALMPANLTSANSEVAKLMYQLGVAQDMQWSGNVSNSFFDPIPLKRFFKYSPKMHSIAKYLFPTTADLIQAIKNELNAGRPVYAKGNNHFYLIDGYNTSNQFHLNFGWGGLYDGYYDITNVTNAAGNFTPTNFMFNIMPVNGDLEIGQDTIRVNAYGGINYYEFTSLLSWNAYTNVSWIHINLTNGNAGYFNSSDSAYFSCDVNNGGERTGKIFIQNANDIDTIVVVQEASPLLVTPDTLFFPDSGGTQTLKIKYFTWSSWNLSSSVSWLTPSSASGTGADSLVTIQCSPNTTTSVRSGFLVITGGVYSDTVQVIQDKATTTSLPEKDIFPTNLFPNPTHGEITLASEKGIQKLILYNYSGKLIFSKNFQNSKHITIDLTNKPKGIYIIEVQYTKGVKRALVIKQ